MKKLLIGLLILTSCSTVRVKERGNDYVRAKELKPVYPQKTDKHFISGRFINPEIWVTRKGRYFYYKEGNWPFRQRRIKLKIKK